MLTNHDAWTTSHFRFVKAVKQNCKKSVMNVLKFQLHDRKHVEKQGKQSLVLKLT